MSGFKLKNAADSRKFKLAQAMWSPDGGRTWRRGRAPNATGPGMVVTKIDHKSGTITVDADPGLRGELDRFNDAFGTKGRF